MKRSLITLLLLAHVPVVFWAFAPAHKTDALWPIPGQTPRDPERVALQVRPEAIALVAESAPVPAPGVAVEAAPAPAASSPVGSAASLPVGQTSAPAAAQASAPTASIPPGAAPAPAAPAVAPSSSTAPVQPMQNTGRQQETEKPAKP